MTTPKTWRQLVQHLGYAVVDGTVYYDYDDGSLDHAYLFRDGERWGSAAWNDKGITDPLTAAGGNAKKVAALEEWLKGEIAWFDDTEALALDLEQRALSGDHSEDMNLWLLEVAYKLRDGD